MKVPFIGPEEDTQKVGASLEPKIGKLATSSVSYGSKESWFVFVIADFGKMTS